MKRCNVVPLKTALALSLLVICGCRTSYSTVLQDEPPPAPEPVVEAAPDNSTAESSSKMPEAVGTGSKATGSKSEPSGSEAAGAEEPYKNTIKWTTASEVDNFGFDVYRSVSEEGPFEKVNSEVIEGAGTTDEPTRYEFVDDTIDPTREYYYYVESTSMSGVREQFTPIGKVRAKLPSANQAESESGSDGVR